ncbi:Uncharacterized protein M6B38_240450 [Iris pallida]|uniref:AB hydrolase-1 domain-containing protein n=1 Tax=Iris pallida TaxID=29817 RepID=A0AAX6DKH6_IRIPA|nr:Uncharacterized protein M6B38_240450 [Iris pallida]
MSSSSSPEMMTWQEELASLVQDTGIRYPAGDIPPDPAADLIYGYREAEEDSGSVHEESFKEQAKGFLKASGELAMELGRGCRDILVQSLDGAEESYVVRKLRGPSKVVAEKLDFLNDYLPEDRDLVQSWMVVISVFLVAVSEFAKCMQNEFKMSMMGELNYLLGLQVKQYSQGVFISQSKYTKDMLKKFELDNVKPFSTPMATTTKLEPDESGKPVDQLLSVNTSHQPSVEMPKKLYIHPPTASHILLPDGRHMSYLEQGVSAERARFSMIAPHSFLSSRLAGIPGIKESLLEEFGVHFITYDLPGFGESDPHPDRNLNSSAFDMLHLADSVGVRDKFWVLGYSSGGMHAWAALHYIPDRIAGAAMFAPMVNPYDSTMAKEERQKTWEKWTAKRKLMYVLARRFPSLLPYFYRRSFLSGVQGTPEKWLSLSLGKKDKTLVGEEAFIEYWVRDVEESVRQRDVKPFLEEAVLQVSNWGFNLADLQVQKKNDGGVFLWLKSMFSPVEREWTGFLGPIHIWQGMDDRVMPPSMTEFVRRVVPGATVHRLLDEGHFSYFCFCDECHRQVFSTVFGVPQGPVSISMEMEELTLTPSEYFEETTPLNFTEE